MLWKIAWLRYGMIQIRSLQYVLTMCRDWVINNARQHILNAFERLTSTRKQAHSSYLASLPNYEVYMRYSGHPPIHPMYVATLQTQIAEAHAELKRGIDADWRASVLRYPEVLDYFYSLVELRLPDDRSREVVEPPFAAAGYADVGYGVKQKKKKRREREGSVPQQHMALRVMRGVPPPAVPTPPIHHNGSYPRPPDPYGY